MIAAFVAVVSNPLTANKRATIHCNGMPLTNKNACNHRHPSFQMYINRKTTTTAIIIIATTTAETRTNHVNTESRRLNIQANKQATNNPFVHSYTQTSNQRANQPTNQPTIHPPIHPTDHLSYEVFRSACSSFLVTEKPLGMPNSE